MVTSTIGLLSGREVGDPIDEFRAIRRDRVLEVLCMLLGGMGIGRRRSAP